MPSISGKREISYYLQFWGQYSLSFYKTIPNLSLLIVCKFILGYTNNNLIEWDYSIQHLLHQHITNLARSKSIKSSESKFHWGDDDAVTAEKNNHGSKSTLWNCRCILSYTPIRTTKKVWCIENSDFYQTKKRHSLL